MGSQSEKRRAKRLANLEESRKYEREKARRLRSNPEYADKIRERQRAAYHKNKEARVALVRFRKTGWTPELFAARFEAQAGLCWICRCQLALPGAGMGAKAACADHDHASARIRGILCALCNSAIGYMSDDADRLRRAADYLDYFISRNEDAPHIGE